MSSEDKTYIFRKFFGFDVKSMAIQLKNIVETEDIELYVSRAELERIIKNSIAWSDFYDKWILNLKTIEDAFTLFIEDPRDALKDVYDSSCDTLKNKLIQSIQFNTKEHVLQAFSLGVLKKDDDY